METLFLSHSHGDHEVANALKDLVEGCFPGHIEVRSSSSSPASGGIGAGSDWLDWIHDQIRTCRFTAVLLTPRSIDKPWLMWEAGAVSGISIAKGEQSTIMPIVYRLSMEQVPSPLRSRQAARGEDRESMRRVLETLKEATPVSPQHLNKYANTHLEPYLKSVATAMAETPPALTDSDVQEWLHRIAYFEQTDRRSEAAQLHRAMVSVFAPGDNGFKTPLDVRIHRRLGDIYLFSKRPNDAVRQFELALKLSPRDIFLMHKNGLALLEAGNEPGAEEMLNRIGKVDPTAVKWSTEIAGLKGRLYWQKFQHSLDREDLRAARDAYSDGLAANPDSHYMADNVGQLSLLLDDSGAAEAAFRKALEALGKTGDKGYWATATKATAHLGLGDRAIGLAALRQVSILKPEPAVLDSIQRGLMRLHKGLKGTTEDLKVWLEALRGA